MDDLIEVDCPECGATAAKDNQAHGYFIRCHHCGYEDEVNYNDQQDEVDLDDGYDYG